MVEFEQHLEFWWSKYFHEFLFKQLVKLLHLTPPTQGQVTNSVFFILSSTVRWKNTEPESFIAR